MKRLLVSTAIVVFLASLLTGVSKIEPGERAVVRRFGRVLDEKPEPGLYIGLPWGIDRVDRIKVDLRRSVQIGYALSEEDDWGLTTPPGQLLTGDYNLVNIQATVYYTADNAHVEQFVFQQDRAETLVARSAEAVLSEWVAGRTYDTVFKLGKQSRPGPNGEPSLRDTLVEKTQQRIAPYGLGVVIRDAWVTFLEPPQEVKDAYDNVTRAETQIKTKEYQARQFYEQKIQEAKAERYRIVSRADAYAREQKLLAEADAKTFLARLATYRSMSRLNPYYLQSLWWTTMSRVYRRMQQEGRIGVLDSQLGTGGVDITTFPPLPKK